MNNQIIFALAMIALAISSGSPGRAQTPFYEGKTVRILVGFSPGGSYDLWARLIATHMGKYVAGNPTFVVQNMTGGGSMVNVQPHLYRFPGREAIPMPKRITGAGRPSVP